MQTIEALASAEVGGLPLSALSSLLGLPKTSLLQLLRALEASGYVDRTTTGFRLGGSSYRLAARIGSVGDLSRVVNELLRDLVAQTGESIVIGRMTNDRLHCRYLAMEPSPHPVRYVPSIDGPKPLHCTSVGKVMLAYSDEATLERYLEIKGLERRTPRTITTKAGLVKELDRVRSTGIAISMEEAIIGGGSLAVPVHEKGGRVNFALVLMAPAHRVASRPARWAQLLTQAAEHLSGYFEICSPSALDAYRSD